MVYGTLLSNSIQTMAATATAKKISVKNLHEYLKTLPPAILDKLYSHPAICLAVFRELSKCGQQYIVRLLFLEQPIPQAVITSWVNPQNYKEHQACVLSLKNLQLWSEVPMPGGLPGWLLHGVFREKLKTILLGGGKPWSTTAALEPDKHSKDIAFLDNYALERWDCILHFLVDSSQSSEGVSNDIASVLIHAGLMKNNTDSSIPTITSEGFQFLLMDTCSQVWYFMLQYLDTIESRNLNLVECLAFVFQLSFSTLGKDYSLEGMSDSMQIFLKHLREFGLVYQRKSRSRRFYPTRLAISLASGLQSSDFDLNKQGYLIVQTNYRVCAYTDAYLQKALVSLFTDSKYVLPNANIGVISRESVRQALQSGISADQIISFLKSHAHPQLMKQNPVIPPVIADQIKLWEMERDRFKFTSGVLYSQFLSQEDFECLRNYAQDIGVLVWENVAKRVMIVSRAGHDDVKRFWKRAKK